MEREYDIILRGTIEIQGTFYGPTKDEALESAMMELRHGDITDIIVDRCVYMDTEPDEPTQPPPPLPPIPANDIDS